MIVSTSCIIFHFRIKNRMRKVPVDLTTRPDPLNRPAQPFLERNFRLPAKHLLCPCHIRPREGTKHNCCVTKEREKGDTGSLRSGPATMPVNYK